MLMGKPLYMVVLIFFYHNMVIYFDIFYSAERADAMSELHRLPLNGEPAHQAGLFAGEVVAGVDRAPIVPDHHVAQLPLVLEHDGGVFGNLEELLEGVLALVLDVIEEVLGCREEVLHLSKRVSGQSGALC